MKTNFPDFNELDLSLAGKNWVDQHFLIYKKQEPNNDSHVLFQTDKWGNGYWVSIGRDINSRMKRIGYWEYYSQEQIEQTLSEVKNKLLKFSVNSNQAFK